MLRNSDLALNGGPPVRSVPFVPSCAIGGDEIARVTECLESHQWSSFLGSCAGFDLREVCTMPSVAAAEYDALELRFLGGKFVRDVEAEFARRWDIPYAVSSNSATSCLVMALAAVNVGPGDEVLVPAMSFNATATSILGVNGIPVFCEVKNDTFCIDPEDMKRRITPQTKAILVVHLGGTNADMDAIMSVAREHGIPVIEDCAQALGVAYNGRQNGTIGDIGVFSFTETKQITCGEGGMLITSNPTYATKARLLRNHGEGVVGEDWPEEDLVNVVGMNFRLTEIQAAILQPQLAALDERNRIRQSNSTYLMERLSDIKQLVPQAPEVGSDYVCYILKWRWLPKPGDLDRDEMAEALIAEGIPVGKGYGGRLMHQNPVFARQIASGRHGFPYKGTNRLTSTSPNYGTGALPRSEQLDREFIWFQFVNYPNTHEDMDDVARAFHKVLGR